MSEQKCQLIPVARSHACEVWLCEECATIHLGIGPVSLRLKLAHFVKAVETLQDAVNEVWSMQRRSGGNLSVSREKLPH